MTKKFKCHHKKCLLFSLLYFLWSTSH